MYLDLLLDAKDLCFTFADSIDVADYDIGVCYLGIPKTFSAATTHISVCADAVVQQLKGERTLCHIAVPDSDRAGQLIFEPVHIQYRQMEVDKLRTLHFTLSDQNDNSVVFTGGQVTIILHLRKKLTWKVPSVYR